MDPAHPQELCLLLALAIAYTGCFTGNRTALMAWLGVLAGVALLTKINMGAIVAVALGLVFTHAGGVAAAWRTLRIVAVLGAFAFPLVLMLPNLAMPWARQYFVLEELSMAAMVVALARLRFDIRLGVRELAICGAGLVGATAALVLFAVAHGSTVAAMFDWLIVKPRTGFGTAWYWAPPGIGIGVVVWAAFGFIAAAFAQSRRAAPWMIALAKLALGVVVLWLASAHQTEEMAIYAATPFLWLVVMPQAAQPRLGAFSRALLGAMGVLVVLYAFPVAGAQISFIVVFLIGAAAVALGDGAYWFAQRLPAVRHWGNWPAYAAFAVVLFRFCVTTPLRAREAYDALQPLGLPGAARLHLEPADAARAHRCSRGLRRARIADGNAARRADALGIGAAATRPCL
jgi:hypothetical protein